MYNDTDHLDNDELDDIDDTSFNMKEHKRKIANGARAYNPDEYIHEPDMHIDHLNFPLCRRSVGTLINVVHDYIGQNPNDDAGLLLLRGLREVYDNYEKGKDPDEQDCRYYLSTNVIGAPARAHVPWYLHLVAPLLFFGVIYLAYIITTN